MDYNCKMGNQNKEKEMEKKGLIKVEIYGYEAIEKTATKAGTTARVYLPIGWAGKKIKVVRLE